MLVNRLLTILILIAVVVSVSAQNGLHSTGGLISVKNGAFISVEGDYQASNNAIIDNTDTIFVRGDWINNAGNSGFNTGRGGTTVLIGNTQYIEGDDVTRFGHLKLRAYVPRSISSIQNTTKFGLLAVEVDSSLALNSHELNMDTNEVRVFNPVVTSVTNNGDGFVSSLENGGLLRHTSSTDTYNFPVGSSVGTARYRPIDIKPNAASPWIYKVRMANFDPTIEGFDRADREPTLCEVNEDYYHRIFSLGQGSGGAADMTFYYDLAQDGAYRDIVHWQNIPEWEVTDPNVTPGTSAPFETLTVSAWNDFSTPAFALGNASQPFNVDGPDELCLNDTLNLTADLGFISYQFFVNDTLRQDDPSNVWTTNGIYDGDSLYVIGVDSTCIAYSYPIVFTVFPLPIANAGNDTTVYFGADVILQGSGGLDYAWLPDTVLDCPICQTPLANVFEDTKFYLTVGNEYGCKTTDTVWIYTSENIDPRDVLFIPTAITPNGDGINEFWNIRNLDLYPHNQVVILNRWGDEIYRSDGAYQNDFKGTYKGTPVPAGTYYYLLKLADINQVLNGPLTVIR